MPDATPPVIPYADHAAIHVDAQRTEPAWATAVKLPTPFVNFQPTPDTPPTGSTDVWLTEDSDGLYVYIVAHDPEPDKLRASLGRRDTRFGDDWVGFYLDPFGTSQRGYLFVVTPAGVLGDGTVTATTEDASWDGIWYASARPTADGYEVEIAVPWRAIRHPSDPHELGLLMLRHRSRIGEKSAWPRLDPDVQGLLVQEGKLTSTATLPPSPGLDLLPELTFGWSEKGPVKPLIGGAGLTPGLTVRYRPTSSVSLLGTVNPDFSQIESDSSQVSVNRRNALYFQEKRPFFLDGQEWFLHPLGELVYTRTMAQPYGGLRFTLEPPAATVAGLYVVDAKPTPSVSEGGGWTNEDIDGHAASSGVLRVRHDLGRDGQIGALYSDRRILGTELENEVGGLDTRIRLSDRASVSGSAMLSSTSFSDGTSAVAPAANAELSYSAHHPFFGTWANVIAPGFRAENGYLPQQDRMGSGMWAGWAFETDSRILPQGNVQPLSVWYAWNFDHELRDLGWDANTFLRFGNGTSLNAGGVVAGELWMDEWLPSRTGWVWFGGPWAKWLETGVGVNGGLAPYYDPADPHSGDVIGVDGNLTVRPVPSLSLGSSATWTRFVDLDGTERYAGYVFRGKAEWFLARTVFSRVVVDGSTFDETKRGEALLAWERSPGTAFYVGGDRSLEGPLKWTVFAKAGVAISP